MPENAQDQNVYMPKNACLHVYTHKNKVSSSIKFQNKISKYGLIVDQLISQYWP